MSPFISPSRGWLALALAALGAPAVAQNTGSTVVITGNPLGNDQLVQPASVLSGDGLLVKRAGTLGETLDGLPGVSSTWFGPNASRPVIRGLDGDRVRMLDNGGASVDASSLSFDHAVAIDPLAVERIEVLRGPAALLYGGNATGGVVNTIDNRIPRAVLPGLSGRAEVRLGGAAAERSTAALLEAGSGSFAWHADAFKRKTDDLRVPLYTPIEGGEALAPTTRVRNSASDADGGAIGGAWVDERGFLGASLDTYRNRYGTTAEPDVFIRMKRDRLALGGERRDLSGWFPQISFQASHTRYEHQEVEGSGEVGTTFKSTGNDLRVEARHAPLGAAGQLTGAIGLQSETLAFSALGEEAFVPDTRTRSNALFVVEELKAGGLAFSAGLRGEQVVVNSAGDPAGAETSRFGAAGERRFKPTSASLGVAGPVAGGWTWTASLGHTERAPAYYELYANGLHVATAAFERGDPTLGVERSRHAEAGLAWTRGADSLKLNVFDTRFSRFISLDATGADIEDGDSPVPEYAFHAVRARLRGAELDGRWRVASAPLALDLTGGLDFTRGDNLDTGEPLPRLAPLRLRAGLEGGQGPWRAGIGLRHADQQTRVPATDKPTPGYTLLNLWLTWQTQLGASEALWFARLDNIGNVLAYNASSTSTLRDLAPLPGRALSAGLRLKF